MHLRIGVEFGGGETRDISLSFDVTTTVGDLARALIRAGITGDSELERIAERRLAPVALVGRSSPDAPRVMLDPATPLGTSGLQSGWTIAAVPEFGPGGEPSRLRPAVGTIEVLDGAHRGVRYSLIVGDNTIGRDPRNRVFIDDRSVSRVHAVLEMGEQARLRDLNSANGILVGDARLSEALLGEETVATMGSVRVCIRLNRHPVRSHSLAHSHPHTRSPRLEPRFATARRELPAPPPSRPRGRIPLLAMLAPMMLGGAMFAVTGAPSSLLMMAFTPLMMVGSWLDGTVVGRRAFRRGSREFDAALRLERSELRETREREIELRGAEAPTLREISAAIDRRDSLLWSRRPEHDSFLELRLGEGELPSRTSIGLPERGQSGTEHWEALKAVQVEFANVDPVPVLERFEQCGSIGIAGDAIWAEGLARSLVMQLVGLHSPAELVIACVAGPHQLGGGHSDWRWLKWLPHVAPATSPLRAWPLAGDLASAARLVSALEEVAAVRRGAAKVPRPTPAIVVVVLDKQEIDAARLIALAEEGPELGIHLIWVSANRTGIPAACRTFVEIDRGSARASFVRGAETVPLTRVEFLEEPIAHSLASRMAPVTDTAMRELDDSDLPQAVDLQQLHEADLLGGPATILANWRATGTLKAAWRAGEEREAIRLAAIVGQGTDGPVELDLRAQGPHALVGGTTGSGKSELLQTWIMALAAAVSPECVTFLLVDYKGGAAFAECTELPHTVGLVTDLDTHLVRRALASLRAELRYREQLFSQRGAKDLTAMERRSDSDAPPALIIVIDEFAALANEVPEFVDGVIDIAQRGRSLGLHLVLATQRPAGAITQNIRANTNLRIALRMADAADSTDVVGVADAAFFDPGAPGRAALSTGAARVSHFQAGFLGGSSAATSASSAHGLELRTLDFGEGETWMLPPEPVLRRNRDEGVRDIERLRDAVRGAADAAGLAEQRRPWLDPLPTVIDLAALGHATSPGPVAVGEGLTAPDAVALALADRPGEQVQVPHAVDFEQIGNLALLGANGTGKTCALVTLAAGLSQRAGAHPVQLYAVDAAGGGLGPLLRLPTVGAVAPLADAELVGRVLTHLRDAVVERAARFSAARCNSLAAYRRTSEGVSEPRVVLLIDGFAAFRSATEGSAGSPFHMLGEIMTSGRAVGVHVVLTTDRAGALPTPLAATVQQQLVFRLAGQLDYGYLGLPPDALVNAPPGRALISPGGEEVQVALLGGHADMLGQASALHQLADSLRERRVPQAPAVRNAPERIALESLAPEGQPLPVIGIDTRHLGPFGVQPSGLVVIAGPAGSGLTTAAVSCAAGVARWARSRGERVTTVLLTLDARGPAAAERWGRVVRGCEEVAIAARELAASLSADPAAPDESERTVIVVERAVDAEGTAALPALVALAQASRRARALVVFEFELGSAAGVWELLTVLRQASWGVALQPDDGDSGTPFRQEYGRARREDSPPGRGFHIERGRATPVHVAESWGILED